MVYGQNRCPTARGWVAQEQRQAKASFINWEQQCPLLGCWLSNGSKLPHFEVLELVYGFWPYCLGNMGILIFQFQVVFSSSSHLWEVIFDSWIKPVLRFWHCLLWVGRSGCYSCRLLCALWWQVVSSAQACLKDFHVFYCDACFRNGTCNISKVCLYFQDGFREIAQETVGVIYIYEFLKVFPSLTLSS